MRTKSVELPLAEPIYSTYHHQGATAALLYQNPSLRNWYLNNVGSLRCNRRFLYGLTTPEVSIGMTELESNPHIERIVYSTRYTGGYLHYIIRALLDNGYYVHFYGPDDYYMMGKSWYHERHFCHNGLITGYDQTDKTYTVYAYDQSWVYRTFRIPQKTFAQAMKMGAKIDPNGYIWGMKAKNVTIAFDPMQAYKLIEAYLDSNLEKYPPTVNDWVHGIVVHDYIARYLHKLHDGSIPYERMDRRVFRVFWEHKKVMHERIQKMEEALRLETKVSNAYDPLVVEANRLRILYASHRMKRRDAALPIMADKVMQLKEREQLLLKQLLENAGKELQK